MNLLIVLILLALAGYVVWKSKTDTGWDIKKGWWALIAGGAAVWEWIHGSISSLLG